MLEEPKSVVESKVPELMRIGHTCSSETFAPQVEDATASLGPGFAFADCPGFLDNRGFEINVANAVNVRHTVAAASSAVVVVVVNYYSLRADRGKGLHDLLSILLGLFEGVGPLLILDGWGIPGVSQLKDVVAFAALVLVLVFRPQGLLGERLAVEDRG